MSTPIIGDTLLGGILLTLKAMLIFMITSRIGNLVLRITLVGVAAYVFYEFFWIVNDKISTAMAVAFSNAQAAGGALGDGLAFAGCMLPTSLSAAFTMLLNIYVLAATVKLTRIFLLAKVGG